jgi:hypothetical protein
MRSLMLLVLALPAMACLNDTEVARQDEEFRSAYPDAPAAASAPQVTPAGYNGLACFAAGMGLSALVGAVLWRRRTA